MEIDVKYVKWLSLIAFISTFMALYYGMQTTGWLSTALFCAGGALMAWHWNIEKFLFIHGRTQDSYDNINRDGRKMA